MHFQKRHRSFILNNQCTVMLSSCFVSSSKKHTDISGHRLWYFSKGLFRAVANFDLLNFYIKYRL